MGYDTSYVNYCYGVFRIEKIVFRIKKIIFIYLHVLKYTRVHSHREFHDDL